MRPTFPLVVRFREDGSSWEFDNEVEAAKSLEWIDSEDPEEMVEVLDRYGRRVVLKIEAHRVVKCQLQG